MKSNRTKNTRRITVTVICILVGACLCFGLYRFYQPYRNSQRLIDAIEENDMEALQLLLDKGVNPNIPNAPYTEGWYYLNSFVEFSPMRPLSVACRNGNLSAVQLLIAHDATAEPVRGTDWDPLSETLFYYQPDDVEIVKLLLQNGADADQSQYELSVFTAARMRPMIYDAQKANGTVFSSGYDEETAMGITEIVILLLGDHSLDISLPSGETLLMCAVQQGNIYLAKHLILAGCDVDCARSDNGKTAYDYAIEHGHHEIAELLKPS